MTRQPHEQQSDSGRPPSQTVTHRPAEPRALSCARPLQSRERVLGPSLRLRYAAGQDRTPPSPSVRQVAADGEAEALDAFMAPDLRNPPPLPLSVLISMVRTGCGRPVSLNRRLVHPFRRIRRTRKFSSAPRGAAWGSGAVGGGGCRRGWMNKCWEPVCSALIGRSWCGGRWRAVSSPGWCAGRSCWPDRCSGSCCGAIGGGRRERGGCLQRPVGR